MQLVRCCLSLAIKGIVLAIAFSACPSRSFADSPPSEPSAPAVKIGVILPLTGAASNLAVIAQKGVELALKSLSETDRQRTTVVYEDDGMVNTRTLTAARKLMEIDKVDALITWSSGSGLTVAGICESKQLPHISIASDPAITKGKRYSFTYWPVPEDEARLFYDYLAAHNKKRVALLTLTHNGALAVRNAFTDIVAKQGVIQVVSNEEASAEMTDLRPILTRIKRRGEIDALIPILFPGQLGTCIKQARELGISAPMYGFETFEDKDEFRATNGLMAEAVYATGADPTPEFIAQFEAAYPGSSYYTASHTYDAVRLLVDATQKSGSGQDMVAFLQGLNDYPTASGSATATGDNRFHLPCTMKRLDSSGNPQAIAAHE
jgi:branched-chain amino acid transport system substrate-binding protein